MRRRLSPGAEGPRIPIHPLFQAWLDHQKRILNFAFYQTGDREMAIEILGEVAVAASEHISAGRKVKNPRALLWTIVRSKIIRLNQGGSAGDRHYKDKFTVAELGEVGSQSIDQAEQIDALNALDRLSKEDRSVIVMTVMLRYTTAETAELLGMTHAVVKNRRWRGIRQLRTLIGVLDDA